MNDQASTAERNGFEPTRRKAPWQPTNALETAPAHVSHRPGGEISNTPLMMSFIAFVLGSIFTLGAILFSIGGFENSWWADYRLGFFVAAWAFFHYAEFAVTAGWNRPKVSVDCEY